MLLTEQRERDTVVIRLIEPRPVATDSNALHQYVMSALARRGVASVAIDVGRVDLVDGSLMNVLKSLVREGGRLGRPVRLRSPLAGLSETANLDVNRADGTDDRVTFKAGSESAGESTGRVPQP